MALTKVGFFFEYNEQQQRYEINKLRRSEGSHDELKILKYLLHGIDAGVSMTLEFDVLCDPPKCLGSALLKTDGEWIWPASLAYFTQTYHLELPAEFIQYMAIKQWQIPQNEVIKSFMPDGSVEM